MNDVRGVPVSGSDRAVLDGYEAALRSYQNFVGDPVATIGTVLAEHSDFVLGHIFRGTVLMTAGERRAVPEARKSLAAAAGLPANDREKGLLLAGRHLLDGEWHLACAAFDDVLIDYPRDIFALQTAHLFDLYRGDSLNLRNRVSRVLPYWTPDVPGYSYLLGMHAFGLEECNQYADAEATGRRALDLERNDIWSVHAVAHVMEMTGRIEEGIEWLESRRDDWAPNNGFAPHNFWHLTLFLLDQQRYDAALAVYDAHIRPKFGDPCLVLVDAAALLWRLYLEDVPLGPRPRHLLDVWTRRADEERGYYAFNDVHAAMAFCLAGDVVQARELAEHLAFVARAGRGSNGAMTAIVGLPLVLAFIAFANGDYATVIDTLLPVRDQAYIFGGSHAQRDVITLTLIEAALRAGRHNLARHLIGERTVHKPASAWGRRLLARAETGSAIL